MFEQDLPGQNTAGYSPDAVVGELPLETCDTMNKSWGFTASDNAFKSPRELIHRLVRAAGHNANLLLNVGPTPEGEFQPEVKERLRAVGTWLETAGVSIYRTRGGPLSPRAWGVSTQTADNVYLHVLEWQDRWLAVPALQGLTRARLLKDGRPVRTVEVDGATVIELPAEMRDPIDTIVVFDRAAPAVR
jgi:alpha-L-fucosidase